MGACSNLSPVEKCLAIIAHGADALSGGNLTLAEGVFRVALAVAKAAPPEQGIDLVPLVLLKMSRLRQKQNREDDARQLQEQAIVQLDQNPPSLQNAFYDFSMANILMEFGEYRRAIPFWEQAIQADDVKDPIDMAHMLSRVGGSQDAKHLSCKRMGPTPSNSNPATGGYRRAETYRRLSTSNGFAMPLGPNRMRRHFHFQPVSYLVRVEADGGSHTEEGDVVVFYFLVQSPDGNAEQGGWQDVSESAVSAQTGLGLVWRETGAVRNARPSRGRAASTRKRVKWEKDAVGFPMRF